MIDFAEVVDRVYGAQEGRDGWRIALASLALHCEASSAVMMVHERRTGRIVFPLQHGLADADRARLTDLYRSPSAGPLRRDDLRLQDLLSQPVGAVRTDTMLSDYPAYLSSPAYRQVYARLGTEHAMGGFVCEGAGRAVAVRLFRSRRDGAFRSREIRRYERLIPHLDRSLGAVRSRALAEQLAALVTSSEILPGASFCVVDEDGGVVLGGGDGERLLALDGGAGRTMASRVLEGAPPARRRLADGRELSAWRVRHERAGVPTGIAVGLCVLTAAGERSLGWRARRLGRAHGLTPAESRLLEALCTLESPNLISAALRLGISRETAKSHLRAIFQKTGVGRQAELLRRVMLDCDGPGPEEAGRQSIGPVSRGRGRQRTG